MVKLSLFGCLSFLIGIQSALASAKIDPALENFGRGATDEKIARVIAIMELAPINEEKPEKYDSKSVISYLRARTKASWKIAETELSQSGALQTSVQPKKLHWINNSLVAEVSPMGLKALAQVSNITKIYENKKTKLDKPLRDVLPTPSRTEDAESYAFRDIGLTQLTSEAPQLTGKGVIIGSVDTGVDGKHPALAGKILRFYDAANKKTADPYDSDSHGTHTVGTMVGGDRMSLRIGVAPEAKVIAAGPLSDYDAMLRAMEYMLEPEGVSTSNSKERPRAVNNSWNCGGAPDIELFYKAISAWEAAGILPVFSAGNMGPKAGSITPPHEHPGVIAIGATGANGKITQFSSRGPGNYKGQQTQKPDITAPGDAIYSTVPGGGFQNMSGTSMATPHVTGSVALLYQIEPLLTPVQVRTILVKTATPLGEDNEPSQPGSWNKVYGFGKMNLYRAAKAVKELSKARLDLVFDETVDLLMNFFTTPEKINLKDFFASAKLKDSDLEMPKAFEGESWVKAEDIWK